MYTFCEINLFGRKFAFLLQEAALAVDLFGHDMLTKFETESLTSHFHRKNDRFLENDRFFLGLGQIELRSYLTQWLYLGGEQQRGVVGRRGGSEDPLCLRGRGRLRWIRAGPVGAKLVSEDFTWVCRPKSILDDLPWAGGGQKYIR